MHRRKNSRISTALPAAVILGLALAILLSAGIMADNAEYSGTNIWAYGLENAYYITDGNNNTYTLSQGATVTVTRSGGLSGLYLVFDYPPQTWTVTDSSTGESLECGINGFLHEYVSLDAFGHMPEEVTIALPEGALISEIYGFGPGDLPDWVQVWEPMLDGCDLLMLSSHSDDEQLFFAGVLPIYAGEKGLRVQVVYLVNHFDTHMRQHEQLDGLWEVGVRNYPLISSFPDLYSESYDGALDAYSAYGYTYDDFCRFITECLRRFRPLVVMTHDFNGEYGHGTHIVCASALKDSLDFAKDPSAFPESAAEYGTWTVEKTYIHLYPENQIWLDLDSPLEKFGGLTAFQVTQKGFRHHVSQHWTWFYDWIYGEGDWITSSQQISTYTPRQYGLFRSEVGPDTGKNDFFENVRTYAAREEEQRLEEERQAEESRRLEEESRQLEEQQKQEAEESRRLEESRKLEEEQQERQSSNGDPKEERGFVPDPGSGLPVILLLALLAAAAAVMAFVYKKGGNKE
ncbi:MAG: PIG-L family deacetylase [Clostridia bacterium]|nr:PIG-L family deacetylase [Clostridia bacterium]